MASPDSVLRRSGAASSVDRSNVAAHWRAPDASPRHVPSVRYPFIPAGAALSAKGPSIAHSTGVIPLSVSSCLLLESTLLRMDFGLGGQWELPD